jgi:hypothetical protein
MVGSYSVHLEATIRRVIQFCRTRTPRSSCSPVISESCVDCFRMFRLLCVARKFRCKIIASVVQRRFSPFFPPNIITRFNPKPTQPSQQLTPLKMCFRTSTSVESTSSSSSDEPIARVIDLPTVRRLNSPRCATRGNAYNLGGSAASDRTHPPVIDCAAAVNADKQKTREFKWSWAVCAMLTTDHSQEVSTSVDHKNRNLCSTTSCSRYFDER